MCKGIAYRLVIQVHNLDKCGRQLQGIVIFGNRSLTRSTLMILLRETKRFETADLKIRSNKLCAVGFQQPTYFFFYDYAIPFYCTNNNKSIHIFDIFRNNIMGSDRFFE